jgi:ABC-type multidrug transport system fused ATPase/permease subunit
MILKDLKNIFYLLAPTERKRSILVFVMILFVAILDMIGIASILPFIAVISNPELVETNIFLNKLFIFLSVIGVNTREEFFFILGLIVFILLLTSLSFKALSTYVQLRFSLMCEFSIAKRLVEGYLHQPYIWFLNRNSADLGKNILSEVGQVVNGSLMSIINFLNYCTIIFFILSLLFLVDLKLTLIIIFILGFSYGAIYLSVSHFLKTIGEKRIKANELRFTSISEAFGAAKEVKVGNLEEIYVNRFSQPAKKYANYNAITSIISMIPRFAIEAISFGGLLLLILYSMRSGNNFINLLPVLTLYAFAGYRILPAAQAVYSALIVARYHKPALLSLYKDMKSLKNPNPIKNDFKLFPKKNIALKNISFNYPNAKKTSLKDVNLEILAGTTVGIVGATGSGKTTIVDIILGLLEAQQGVLEIDGNIINKDNVRSWQRSIGYVPQQIYLADDTISGNIAFGVNTNEINQESVKRAAKIANLDEFIINELPEKYETYIGERGVRLSGGQRQRIGLARALYHKPKVLILDEATSALDNITEKSVMKSINELNKDITSIFIAHRLTTIKNCDTIFLFDKGELKAEGSFKELTMKNKNFWMMQQNN